MSGDYFNKVIFFNGSSNSFYDEEKIVNDIPLNSSDLRIPFLANRQEQETAFNEIRKEKIYEYKLEIYATIQQDDFIDGEISQSEFFIQNALENDCLDYVMEALMQIYYNNLSQIKILEGILIMISSIPYDSVLPKGQIMAIGLVSHKNIVVRDRALQCFEKWNSKKGLDVLYSLDCHPQWLQKYVNEIIKDIERDGID